MSEPTMRQTQEARTALEIEIAKQLAEFERLYDVTVTGTEILRNHKLSMRNPQIIAVTLGVKL